MITEFQGDFRWLSNFAPVSISLDGRVYSSVEHAYMSAKCNDPAWKNFCTDPANSPGAVKKASRNLVLVANWNAIKVSVMAECIKQKFTQEPYKSKLLATGSQHIQEGNRWGDTFWGVDLRSGKGRNVLGRLIMCMRERLI